MARCGSTWHAVMLVATLAMAASACVTGAGSGSASAPTPAAGAAGELGADVARPQTLEEQADALMVHPSDHITESALADIENLPKSVEDVQAADVAEDLADDVPPPPTQVGAALASLKEAQAEAALVAEGSPPWEASGAAAPGGSALWVETSLLAVRAGPSPSAKRVGTLSRGAAVVVLQSAGDFVRIGQGRWVARRFLSDHKGAVPSLAH